MICFSHLFCFYPKTKIISEGTTCLNEKLVYSFVNLCFTFCFSTDEVQREVQCLLCKRSFTTKILLTDHYENFHNVEALAATAALLEGPDRDQKTHVDHSYSRAENGDQGESNVDSHDEEEGPCKEGGSVEKKTEIGEGEEETEIDEGKEEKVHIVGGAEKAVIVGGEKKTEKVEAGEGIFSDATIGIEAVIKRTSDEQDQDAEGSIKVVVEIRNKKVMDAEEVACSAEIGVMDSIDKEKNEGELEESGSQSPCGDDGLSNSTRSRGHREESEEEMDVEEESDGQNREVTEDTLEERLSPFEELQGGSTALDSIHSDHLDENDDSNTFMEQIHLETGDDFEGSFSDVDDHEEETPHSEEDIAEMMPEYEEGDFRFISGLRHRQIHIANSNLVTDIGMQVFICLHCDFLDSESGLVNHMQRTHKEVLELESAMLEFSREVPADRVFPENVTGEEVMMLSEYHRRNLEQKHGSGGSRKRTARTDGVREKRHLGCISNGETLEKKKRYVENRVPCLCPECGKVLCRKSALRTHILGVHSRSRNHLCEVCGKAFRASYHLSQHRKSHRTKTFSCDLCDFTSDVRMDIFDHQQLHPNKFILCHVCGTVLKSKTALKRHMMVHSETRPFACTVEGCTWRFTSEALCKGHIESHNSPGEFICLECKRRFRKRHHIRRHLKMVHGKISNSDADKFVAVDAKIVPSAEQFGQIPVTQLSKQHIVITTDEHGTPIFCDQNEELVFDSKTSSLLQVTVKHSDGI